MATRNFGAPIRRNEDARLLSGQALFVDDVELPGMLHAAFLRSNVAHARDPLDRCHGGARARTAWSRSIPPPISATIGRPDRFWCRRRRSRASSSISAPRCRSPRTKCVTSASRWPWCWRESRYLAEDALADIVVELEPLPAVVDLEKALTPSIRARARRCARQCRRPCPAEPRQLRRRPRHAPSTSSRRRFYYDHGASSPIETRGIVANWDARANQLTIWDTTQAPVFLRNGLAAMLGLSERQVRVIAPFVGGGFGPKIMLFYPEEVVIPWAAMKAQPPDQMDRGPARAFLRHHAGARPDPRRRDRADARRPHPRHQGRVPARYRRLQSLWADGADQQPVHAARALRDPELRQHVHGRLHQQADRHALSRRRPPAWRVRHRAAARHCRARN